jgi:hypothetical protein
MSKVTQVYNGFVIPKNKCIKNNKKKNGFRKEQLFPCTVIVGPVGNRDQTQSTCVLAAAQAAQPSSTAMVIAFETNA